MYKKYYRSRKNYMVAGLCGGLAEYFNIDPVIFRLLTGLTILMGPGIIIYLIAWLVVPLSYDFD